MPIIRPVNIMCFRSKFMNYLLIKQRDSNGENQYKQDNQVPNFHFFLLKINIIALFVF